MNKLLRRHYVHIIVGADSIINFLNQIIAQYSQILTILFA